MRFRLLGDHSAEHCGPQAVVDVLKSYLQRHGEIVGDGEPCDALVVNGEGSMHHDRRNCLDKMESIALSQAEGLPTYLVNTVWDSNHAALTPYLAACENIVVRGRSSAIDLARRHGVNSHIALDLSYHRPIDDEPGEDFAGGVVMTDHWASDAYGFCWLSRSFASDFRPIDMARMSWSALVNGLRTASMVLAGRHHAVYAACKARTPFVAIRGNCHKMEDILHTSFSRIPICEHVSQILPAMRWAERNPGEYERLFDWMDARPFADFLHDKRIKQRRTVTPYRPMPPATLAQAAQARGDFAEAARRWLEASGAPGLAAQTRDVLLLRAFRALCRTRDLRSCFAFLADLDAAERDRLAPELTLPVLGMLVDGRVWSFPLLGVPDPTGEADAFLLARRAVLKAEAHEDAEATDLFDASLRRFAEAKAGDTVDAMFCLCAMMGVRAARRFRMAGILEAARPVLLRRPDLAAAAAAGPLALFFGPDELEAIYDRASASGRQRLLRSLHFVRSHFQRALCDSLALLRTRPERDVALDCARNLLWAGTPDQVEATGTIVRELALAGSGSPAIAAAIGRDAREHGDESLAPLWGRMEADRANFEAFVTGGSATIAVVGNSGVELGGARGAEIDAHAHVVRFNEALRTPPPVEDYGARCTILAVTDFTTDLPSILADLAPDVWVLANSVAPWSPRFERHPLHDRVAAGGRTVFVPGACYRRLCEQSVQSPSLGLTVTAYLKSLRPDMPRSRFYGFSLIDQLDAAAPRLVGTAPVHGGHDWALERTVFDALFEDA